jgi:23S rRNA (uracil1939-C5)-methyltransferase
MTAEMTVELTIEAMGAGGDGVACIRGEPVYAPFTLPGERVRARIEGGRGRLVEILEASPARAAPVCRHFGQCGGCALQHWRREDYLRWKSGLVAAALRQHGAFHDVDEVV